MPIDVNDLKPGDRVLLACPASRGKVHREAVFVGRYASVADACAHTDADANVLIGGSGATARASQLPVYPVAGFLMEVRGRVTLTACFRVNMDGSMTDGEWRDVFVERRLPPAAFG